MTSLSVEHTPAQALYEQRYCARGDMENRIKEQQLALFADRTSAATMRTNQLQLYFSSLAYTLLQTLRRLGLKGTALAKAHRALDKFGNTIDFYLSATRNTKAAKRFLGKALNGLKDWELPEVLNTDKALTYAGAIAELKAEGKCPNETRHRQVKYLNNVVEADHGKLKLLLRPVRGFKTLKTALRHDQGLRGDARAAQGPSWDIRSPGRHRR